MKKRTVMLLIVFALVAVAVGIFQVKNNYPDLEAPIINHYIGEVPESSAGSRYKTYFFDLSPIEKQAYNLILADIYNLPERILVPDLSEKQLDGVFRALLNDNPDLIFLGRKCRLTSELWNNYISFDYIMTREEYQKADREMREKRDLIIASLSDLSDEYRCELEIHDYIISNCAYELKNNEYFYSSAYGALINGKAACEGYSKAAKFIFDKVGIESALVSGKADSETSKGGDHMWNIVKINGNYYHLDLTWDDPVSKNSPAMSIHTYFNLTDEAIGVNHRDFSYNPGCTSTDENYYVKNGLRFEKYSKNDETRLRDLMLKQFNAGERCIQISFMNKESYDSAFSSLVTGGRIYKVLSGVKSSRGNSLANSLTGYYEDKNFFTLTFIFK